MKLAPLIMLLCLAQIPFADEPLFTCDFETENWYEKWGEEQLPRNTSLVTRDDDLKFAPHDGAALKIRVEKDGHYGTSFGYSFINMTGAEPEEIVFQYALRLADDWAPERGGKLPGIGGTYGRAGWGGRPVHGDDGWSARGLFKGMIDGVTPIGYYAYQMDMKGQYGSSWTWDQNGFRGLENNRWYVIRQHIKLNDPGKPNGIAQAWVDGTRVFEKTDVRYRSVDSLKIETVWMNLYHGGKWTALTEQHIFIDDVVITIPEE